MNTSTEFRERWLGNKYGLTEKRFAEMLSDQNGRCKICGTCIHGSVTDKQGKEIPRAKVDHDHETGIVRGLLCGTCNTGLGMFKDSIRNLANAIVYLEDYGKSF